MFEKGSEGTDVSPESERSPKPYEGLEREAAEPERAVPESDRTEPEPECANGNKPKRQRADGTELNAKCGHTEGTELEPEQDAEGTA